MLKHTILRIVAIAVIIMASQARASELTHEVIVDAASADVWKAWTVAEEIETWMVKKADIDLRVGGLLRTSYNPDADLDGSESIHHRILSYEPNRMLSFRTVKSPAGFPYPELIEQSWVVVTLESIGTERTRVRIAMCGYGEGDKWEEMRDKFDAGNAWTCEQLRSKFARDEGDEDALTQEADAVLSLLGRFVGGEWVHESEDPGGSAFRVRNVIRHGPDGKSIVARGWVGNNDNQMAEHGSMLAFRDPDTQDVRFVNVNEVGDIAEGPITLVNENTIEWDWRMRGEDNHTYSVQMEFTGENEYIFTLRLRLEDGSMQQLVQADFHRVEMETDKKTSSAPAKYEHSGTSLPVLERVMSSDETFESYRAHLAAAQAALDGEHVRAAKSWLGASPAASRGWEWSYLLASADQASRVIQPAEGGNFALAISPDGSRIAVGTTNNSVAVIDAKSGQTIGKLVGHENAIFDVAFSRDGSRLASASRDKTIRLWNPHTLEHITTLTDPDSHVMGVAFNPDGTKLAASILSYVRIWNLETGEIERTLKGHLEKPPVLAVEWSADGKHLVSASWDNWCIVWNLETGEPQHTFGPGYGGEVYTQFHDVAISPNGSIAAGAGGNGSIHLWDLDTGEVISVLKDTDHDIFAVAFRPDGKQIAAAVSNGTIQLWNVDSHEKTATLRGHDTQVRDLAYLADGTTLVSASMDETLRYWSSDAASYQTQLAAVGDIIWQMDFLPGDRLALACNDNKLRIVNGRTGEILASYDGHDKPVIAARASKDGRRLVTSSNDGTARIWNLESGICEHVLRGHDRVVSQASISPDGSRVVTAGYDGTLRLWNADTGEQMSQISNASLRCFFTRGGSQIVAGGRDGVLRIFDGATLELIRECPGHEGAIGSIALAQDGALIATGSDDRTIRLWDPALGKCISVLEGHDEPIYGLAFSPDATRLASGGYDRSVRVWDVQAAGELLTLTRSDNCWALEWSPDGRSVMTPLFDEQGRVHVFTSP